MTPISDVLLMQSMLKLIDRRYCTKILSYDELIILEGVQELMHLYQEVILKNKGDK